jgi:hypothetical protein
MARSAAGAPARARRELMSRGQRRPPEPSGRRRSVHRQHASATVRSRDAAQVGRPYASRASVAAPGRAGPGRSGRGPGYEQTTIRSGLACTPRAGRVSGQGPMVRLPRPAHAERLRRAVFSARRAASQRERGGGTSGDPRRRSLRSRRDVASGAGTARAAGACPATRVTDPAGRLAGPATSCPYTSTAAGDPRSAASDR